ncbi:MAG: hypothetical protein EHM12_13195, partial [Dehalococcoidia bacterium]
MFKKGLFILLLLTLIISPLTVACKSETSTTTSTQTTTATTKPISTTAVTTTTPPATQANWWDKWGEPVYGGRLKVGAGAIMGMSFDLYSFMGAEIDLWYESLFEPSWTSDRKEWSMTGMFYPDQYW